MNLKFCAWESNQNGIMVVCIVYTGDDNIHMKKGSDENTTDVTIALRFSRIEKRTCVSSNVSMPNGAVKSHELPCTSRLAKSLVIQRNIVGRCIIKYLNKVMKTPVTTQHRHTHTHTNTHVCRYRLFRTRMRVSTRNAFSAVAAADFLHIERRVWDWGGFDANNHNAQHTAQDTRNVFEHSVTFPAGVFVRRIVRVHCAIFRVCFSDVVSVAADNDTTPTTTWL